MFKINWFTTYCLGLIILFASSSRIHANPERELAFVLKITGDAQVRQADQGWRTLKKGTRLRSGDRIKTGANTIVAIVFIDDKTMMKIRSDSEIQFQGEKTDKGIHKRLSMEIGEMWTRVTPGGAGFRLETPSGIAAVKGTEYYGIVDQFGNMTIIAVSGLLELFNELGSILVNAGQTGRASKGQGPTISETEDFDHWADSDDIEELEVEFKNSEGVQKTLKIKYRQK